MNGHRLATSAGPKSANSGHPQPRIICAVLGLKLYSARNSRVASAITTGYAAITVRVGYVGAFGRHYS